MRWYKEYDDDTIINYPQTTFDPSNLDVNIDNSKMYVSFEQHLPEPTKQKAYTAIDNMSNNSKIIQYIIYIFLGPFIFIFFAQFCASLITFISHLTSLDFNSINFEEIKSIITSVLMLLLFIIIIYCIGFKMIIPLVNLFSTTNLQKAFQNDKYKIITESVIIDKPNATDSNLIQIESGKKYNPLFSNQYSQMNIGDAVYVIKILSSTGVILK